MLKININIRRDAVKPSKLKETFEALQGLLMNVGDFFTITKESLSEGGSEHIGNK